MKNYLSLIALFTLVQVLAAQPIDQQPEVLYHQTGFLVHNYFTVGDSIVSEEELAFYFKTTDLQAYEAFNYGLKLDRKRRVVEGFGLAGIASALLTNSRSVDIVGYGGFALSGLVALGLEMWSARKKGTGVYLYNSKRSWKAPDPWQPPAPKEFEQVQPYKVIDGQ
ncbi:hypothetical protein [Phaeodactylibacter xiamenensis]|jgi:hypothetical protein|uniref:hypothetical protein n=1 Tax=Phaeodactylibacter xiamenensis TaxID=1524460 RepID=UPI0024A7DD1E|nr:hypothetical protein [Phaeodactylibacter xiamenensis]